MHTSGSRQDTHGTPVPEREGRGWPDKRAPVQTLENKHGCGAGLLRLLIHEVWGKSQTAWRWQDSVGLQHPERDLARRTYTHLLHAHFSVAESVCAHPHIFMRVHKQVWLKCLWKDVCRTCVFVLYLAFSLLMFHPSLLFLYIHFYITFSVHLLAELSRPKSAGHAPLRTCIAKFGYLAKSDANTGYEPKEFDKITSVDNDTMLIDGPDARTLDCSVFLQSLKPLFRTFLMVILLFKQKTKKACIGKPIARQKEREQEESGGSVISVALSMSKKSRRNNIRSHSLQTLRKFSSDGWDLWEHLQRRAPQAISGENSVQRKLDLNEYKMEIQNLKRRDSEYALFESQRELESQRQQPWEANQSKLNVRKYICVANWRWRTTFIKKAMWEVAEKLKNWKYAAIKRKSQKIKEDWTNFSCSMIRNHEQWVHWVISDEDYKNDWNFLKTQNHLRSWLCEQLWRTYVPRQALITSSSRKPSREVGMLRNARESMSIPGNVFDCQHVRRDPDELHNDSRNLATSLAILRTEGIEKSGSEEPLQSILLPCFSQKARGNV